MVKLDVTYIASWNILIKYVQALLIISQVSYHKCRSFHFHSYQELKSCTFAVQSYLFMVLQGVFYL